MPDSGKPDGAHVPQLLTSDLDVLTTIRNRRSIRRYTGDPISESQLETILDAGFCAPSASNRRPWHFVVIRSAARLQEIAAAHPYAKMMPAAGCCIVVCGDRGLQPAPGLLVEDCSAAIQNMLLAAHGLGLGAVWCGIYVGEDGRHDQFAQLLSLPEGVLAVGMIAVGHPAETKTGTDRFDAARIHQERW